MHHFRKHLPLIKRKIDWKEKSSKENDQVAQLYKNSKFLWKNAIVIETSLLKLQTGIWLEEKYIPCVLRMNINNKRVFSVPTWKGITALIYVLYKFTYGLIKVQHLCFLFKNMHRVFNEWNCASKFEKWKANENKTNKIIQEEGREAAEINSSHLEAIFLKYWCTCGSKMNTIQLYSNIIIWWHEPTEISRTWWKNTF